MCLLFYKCLKWHAVFPLLYGSENSILSASVVLQKFFLKDRLGKHHYFFVEDSSGGTSLLYDISKIHIDTVFIVQTGAHF